MIVDPLPPLVCVCHELPGWHKGTIEKEYQIEGLNEGKARGDEETNSSVLKCLG